MNLPIPFGKRILVKRADAQAVSEGGIYIPDTTQQSSAPDFGTIIAKGTESVLAVETKVYWPKYAGTPIELDRQVEKYLVLDEEDVIAFYPVES